MRKVFTTLMLAVACLTQAQSMVWLQSGHDFGTFREDLKTVYCKMIGVNMGSEPVAIVDARANCGCTVPNYSRELIQPGDTTVVEVAYNAEGAPGKFAKRVTVETSDGVKGNFMVKGTVIASEATIRNRYPVKVGRANLGNTMVMFGTCNKGGNLYGRITVYNATDSTIEPRVANVPDYMTARFSPAVIKPGELSLLSFSANSNKTDRWGLVADHFLFYSDKGEDADSAVISTSMTINEDFKKLTPQQLADAPVAKFSTLKIDFDRIVGNKPITKEFTIANTGKTPLMIRRIDAMNNAVTFTCLTRKVAPGENVVIEVTLDPKSLPKDTPLNTSINLILNAPATPNVEVRLVGTH